MANEQETQLPPTDESAPVALAHGPKKLEQPAMWPGNVPNQAQALEVLRGQRTLVVSLPGARKLQEKLTLPEREALQDDGLADSLRDAVAVRWRLAAAQDLLLTAGGRVDEGALNTLLAEVDRALEALRAATPASPDLGLAIDRTWETLTQEAVDFSTNVKAAANQPVAPVHPVHAAPKKPAATGKVTFQAEETDPRKQGKARTPIWLYAVLGVAVAAAGAYHFLNATQLPPQPPAYPGAPPNTVILPDTANGALVVRSMLIGPTSPELQSWLKQQEAKGMQVKELGPGNYVLTPSTKPPATAGNTTP